uniref:N-acetylated alpha-linked acidic dipeptidase like 2 n=1 Tax=Sinocyclocheilus rhinocerous TaxID=307959 RepID=A0A673JY32_9TELE
MPVCVSTVTDMAYQKVRAGHGSLRVRDLESEELHTASLELEWDMEKELEEPGLDRFQLECVEHQPVSSSSGGGMDPYLEPIQPSVSPHRRFERLQEDPNYVSRFSRSVPKGQRRNGTCLAKYLLAGMGVFALGLLIGRYAFMHCGPSEVTDTLNHPLLREILVAFIDVFFLLCLLRHRDFDSLSDLTEESKVRYIAQRWDELGLKDVQVTNHTALLSYPGPALSTIIDKSGNQCYLPSGVRCDQPFASTTDRFAFAAYSAVGNLVAEVVDVQYGSPEDLRRVQASANVTNKIALLKLGQFPLLYKLSLLAEVGFGGSLLYVDPCDAPFGNKTFGVTLNPGGNPFSEEDARSAGRDSRHNLTSLLVQPISASLAKMLLSAPAMGQGRPCIPMAMPSASARKIINLTIENQASFKTVHNVIGYLKGKTNPGRSITAEAILRLATDPVLPFYPLDIALDVQNKLKGKNASLKTYFKFFTKKGVLHQFIQKLYPRWGTKRENIPTRGTRFILSASFEPKKPRGSNELLTDFYFQMFFTFSKTCRIGF